MIHVQIILCDSTGNDYQLRDALDFIFTRPSDDTITMVLLNRSYFENSKPFFEKSSHFAFSFLIPPFRVQEIPKNNPRMFGVRYLNSI